MYFGGKTDKLPVQKIAWSVGIRRLAFSIPFYAALAGQCLWDKKTCHDIYGFLPGSGYQRLDLEFWEGRNVDLD